MAAKRLPALAWRPGEVDLFLRQEAGLLVHLHHPSVIKFYGVGQSKDYVYVVAELCDGSLTNLIDGSLTNLIGACNAQHPAPAVEPQAVEAGKEVSTIDAARAGRGGGGSVDKRGSSPRRGASAPVPGGGPRGGGGGARGGGHAAGAAAELGRGRRARG